ncbi:hypothetical protein ES704_02345 [subsurface metagenome]|jgi:hypothetical protein
MRGISAEELRDLILSVGTHKQERPLSPIEVAMLLETAIESGTTIEQISDEILLDSTMINRFLRLLNLALEIQHVVGWRGKSRVSFSTASEIARLETPEEQELLGKATLENRLSKREVIQIIEVRNKFNKPIGECVEEILKMRPRVIRRYLFIGAIKSLELQNKLSKMSQKERDILFDNVVALNLPDLPSWDGLLGTTRFTLIGNEDLNQALSNLPTDFAESINNFLESSIK